jgi:hypothetical protein
LPKISELKKLSAEVKILNLINYLTICCQNGKGNTIVGFMDGAIYNTFSLENNCIGY